MTHPVTLEYTMSAVPRFVRALRQRIQAQPGITALPVCPACRQEREPHDFTSAGTCRDCYALTPSGTLAMVLNQWVADQDALARELLAVGFRPTPAMLEAHPELVEQYSPRYCVRCHHDITSWGECPTCEEAF